MKLYCGIFQYYQNNIYKKIHTLNSFLILKIKAQLQESIFIKILFFEVQINLIKVCTNYNTSGTTNAKARHNKPVLKQATLSIPRWHSQSQSKGKASVKNAPAQWWKCLINHLGILQRTVKFSGLSHHF